MMELGIFACSCIGIVNGQSSETISAGSGEIVSELISFFSNPSFIRIVNLVTIPLLVVISVGLGLHFLTVREPETQEDDFDDWSEIWIQNQKKLETISSLTLIDLKNRKKAEHLLAEDDFSADNDEITLLYYETVNSLSNKLRELGQANYLNQLNKLYQQNFWSAEVLQIIHDKLVELGETKDSFNTKPKFEASKPQTKKGVWLVNLTENEYHTAVAALRTGLSRIREDQKDNWDRLNNWDQLNNWMKVFGRNEIPKDFNEDLLQKIAEEIIAVLHRKAAEKGDPKPYTVSQLFGLIENAYPKPQVPR